MESFDQLVPLTALLPGFVMVLFRISGIMVVAPFFGSAGVPGKVKVGLSLILAIALWPVLGQQMFVPPTLPAIIAAALAELLVGLTIGLSVAIIFAGVQLAATTISQQMGIGLADVFNPEFGESSDVLGVLSYWVGLMIFLAIGGHRMLIGSLLDSFVLIPPGGFVVNDKVIGLLAGALSSAFVMAFKMSLPVVLALFLASIALGLINRTVPQLNILTAGFAIRTSVGMLLVAATIVAMMAVFLGTIEQAMLQVNGAISQWVAR